MTFFFPFILWTFYALGSEPGTLEHVLEVVRMKDWAIALTVLPSRGQNKEF